MLLLLAVIVGCSPEGQVYQECVAYSEFRCECNEPNWVCPDPSEAAEACEQYDLTVCDARSERFDAEACERAEFDVQLWEEQVGTPENLETIACIERVVRRQCSEARESDEAAVEIWTAAYEACR